MKKLNHACKLYQLSLMGKKKVQAPSFFQKVIITPQVIGAQI